MRSLCPAFIFRTSFGKYETVSICYNNHEVYTYEEFLSEGYKDREFMNYIPFCVTDAMNSEGLYTEANVREPNRGLLNTDTAPGKEKVYVSMLVQMIAMNCATVREAVDYLNSEISICSTPYIDFRTPTQYAFTIGDATGEFGLIEIAEDRVSYVPYQQAQANYYITANFSLRDTGAAGYGRMESVLEGLSDVNDIEAMMEHMKKPMWNKYILDIDYGYKDENDVVHFVNAEGEPSIDWRSDLTGLIPLDEKGELSEHVDDAALERCDARWMERPEHFELAKTAVKKRFDGMQWKEKLTEYYNGNELPLRSDGNVLTTGVSYAVNCAEKRMLVKFWEKEEITFDIRFD